jgi:hypothetical protein
MRISKTDLSAFPRFALVPSDTFILDSLCFFVGENLLYLQAILNSEFAAYYFFNNIAILDNGGMQMRQQFIELMPIPVGSDMIISRLEQLAAKISENIKDTEAEINELVFSLFEFTNEEIDFIKNAVHLRINEITLNIR